MEFEPMLTPREKSPLPESFPRGGSNPRRCGQRAQTLPTSYSGPPPPPPPSPLERGIRTQCLPLTRTDVLPTRPRGGHMATQRSRSCAGDVDFTREVRLHGCSPSLPLESSTSSPLLTTHTPSLSPSTSQTSSGLSGTDQKALHDRGKAFFGRDDDVVNRP